MCALTHNSVRIISLLYSTRAQRLGHINLETSVRPNVYDARTIRVLELRNV